MKLAIFTATHPAAFVFLILSLFCSISIAVDPPAQAPPAVADPAVDAATTATTPTTELTTTATTPTPAPVKNNLPTTTPTTAVLPTTKTTKTNTNKADTATNTKNTDTTTNKLPPPVTTTTPPAAQTPTTTPPIRTLKSIRIFTPTSVPLTSTSTVDNTIVWMTTTEGGITSVYSTAWVQTFTSMYSKVAIPSSGAIGLGTISGTVGTPRYYKTLTFS